MRCQSCLAFAPTPTMTAAAPSLPPPSRRPSSLPRLNRVLSAAARAALAARRAGLSHAPETRAKISSTARRNRALRDDAAVAMAGVLAVEAAQDAADGGGGGEKKGARKVRSAEHRENIGAALRGRRLSKAHREKLSARFSGENNPMYGRKLSEESRAKISTSLRRARAKKVGKAQKGEMDEEKKLTPRERREVMGSRLVTSMRESVLSEADVTEEAVLDELLQRVASGECPPAAVKRVREEARRKAETVEAERDAESDVFVSAAEVAAEAEEDEVKTVVPIAAPVAAPRPGKLKSGRKVSGVTRLRAGAVTCGTCEGSGSVVCMNCVGQVGLASRHCEACSGAAVTFCPACLGTGESPE